MMDGNLSRGQNARMLKNESARHVQNTNAVEFGIESSAVNDGYQLRTSGIRVSHSYTRFGRFDKCGIYACTHFDAQLQVLWLWTIQQTNNVTYEHEEITTTACKNNGMTVIMRVRVCGYRK